MSLNALLAWSLLACCARCGETSPTQQQNSGDIPRQAAEITLLVFRATVKDAGNAERYYVLPSRAPLARHRAAAVLAGKGKPLECTGGMEGGILAVECLPITDVTALESHRDAAKHGTSVFEEEVRQRCPEPLAYATLVVHRRGDSVRVAFRALAVWFRDYKAAGYTLGVEESKGQSRGTCMVIGIGPPGRIRIQQESGPLRSRT